VQRGLVRDARENGRTDPAGEIPAPRAGERMGDCFVSRGSHRGAASV